MHRKKRNKKGKNPSVPFVRFLGSKTLAVTSRSVPTVWDVLVSLFMVVVQSESFCLVQLGRALQDGWSLWKVCVTRDGQLRSVRLCGGAGSRRGWPTKNRSFRCKLLCGSFALLPAGCCWRCLWRTQGSGSEANLSRAIVKYACTVKTFVEQSQTSERRTAETTTATGCACCSFCCARLAIVPLAPKKRFSPTR